MPFDTIDQDGYFLNDDSNLRAIVIFNPLKSDDRQIIDLEWSSSKTLEDYLDGLPDTFDWSVFASGNIVPRESWGDVSLKSNDTIIIMPILHGDAGKYLGLIAMVALTIFAPQIGVFLLGGAASAAALGTIGGIAISSILGSAVALAGGLLITSMMGKPNSSTPTGSTTSSYGLDGPKNTAIEGLAVPVVYGTFRIAGNKTNFYVENSADGLNQVLYIQYLVSDGVVDNIDFVEINDLPITYYQTNGITYNANSTNTLANINATPAYVPGKSFDTVTWDWRAGTADQNPISWFDAVITPYSLNYVLTQTPYIYQTSSSVSRIRVDFVFPQGLYKIDGKGNLQNATVTVNLEYRKMTKNSFGTWVPNTSAAWVSFASDYAWHTISGVANTGTTQAATSGLRITVLYDGSNGTASTAYHGTCNLNSSTLGGIITHNLYNGNNVDVNTGANAPTTAINDSSSNFSFVDEHGNVFNAPYYDGSVVSGYNASNFTRTYDTGSIPNGIWNWTVTGGTVVSVETYTPATLTWTKNQRNAVRVSGFSPPVDYAHYEVRMSRTTAESTLINLVDQIVANDINEINDDVIGYTNSAYYAVRVQLGKQINGEPKCTALVRGKHLAIYDRTGAISATVYSNNPADVFLDILLNPRHKFGIDASQVDFVSIDNWRQYCATNTLAFNGVFDSITNVWDAISTVARIGRASPVLLGLKYGVVIEAPANPTMMFTQDMMIKDTFQNEWTGRKGRANIIEVQYSEPNDHYRQHSVFAIDDSFIQRGEARIKSSLNLIGCTNSLQADNEAWLQLNLNRYLVQSIKFDCFVQAIGCIVGDVVLIQHDMPQWGYSAMIIAVSGNQIIIDSDIPAINESDWNILLLRSVTMFANATIGTVSGNKIQLANIISPSIDSTDAALSTIATSTGDTINIYSPSSSIAEFTSDDGCSRILIAGVDYEVVDSSVFAGNVILTLDRTVSAGVGAEVQCFKTDLLCNGTLSPFQNTRSLNISNWTNKPGNPRVGDRVMMGRTGQYKKPFRIHNISYHSDHIRSIAAIEYNASVYGSNPAPTPNYSSLSVFPSQVGDLVLKQTSTTLSGGALNYFANIHWTRPLQDQRGYAGVKLYQSIDFAAFTFLSDVASPIEDYVTRATLGTNVRIQAVAYYNDGSIAALSSAPIAAITITSTTEYPTDIIYGSVTIVGGIRQITIKWTQPSTDIVSGTQVYVNSSNDISTAILAFAGNVNTYTHAGLNPLTTEYFWLRTVSLAGRAGNYIGPFSATTSQLIAADLADGILNTAKFASSIKAPYLIDNLSVTGTAANDLAVNTSDGKLYKWSGSVWTAVVNTVDLSGQITNEQIVGITAAKLTTQILRTNIADGEITTPKLNSGAVTADKIFAGAVTASKLTLSAGNMIPDTKFKDTSYWSFQTYATGWFLDTGGIASALGISPAASLASSGFSGSNYTAFSTPYNNGNSVGAIPDTAYTLSATGFNGGNKDINVALVFYNAAGTYLSSTTVVWVAGASTVTTKRVQITAPNGAATIQVVGEVHAGAAWSGGAGIGGITVVPAASAEMIVDGSISAVKILAGSVTADRIVANDITAAQIHAGAIGATEIAVNQLHAYHLASDFALINSAQIGSLTVDTLNVKGGAMSYFASSYNEYAWVPPTSMQTDGGCTVSITVTDPNEFVLVMFKESHEFYDPVSANTTGGTVSGSASSGYANETNVGGPG